MKIERTLTANGSPETLRDRIASYFSESGFQADSAGSSPLVYRRGTRWGSFSSVTPENWQATAEITLQTGTGQPSTIAVSLLVDTALQWVTEKQRAFWQCELQDLEAAIQTGSANRDQAELARQAALSETLKANLAILLAGLVIAALFFGVFQRPAAILTGLALGWFMGIAAADRLLKFQPEDQLDPLFHPDLARAELQSLARREIRAWGVAAVLLGIVHLATAGLLNAPWGISLILVGLVSFYFSTPAMFIIYSLALAWAAVTNAFTGDLLWLVFAAFQLVLAVVVFRRFQRFLAAQSAVAEIEPDEETGSTPGEPKAQAFTLSGLILAVVSLLGFIAIFLGVLASLRAGALDQEGQAVVFLEGMAVNLGLLGFATGLASLLSGFPRRPLAILSMAAGGLVVLAELALSLLHL
jgi:hypothetical protein